MMKSPLIRKRVRPLLVAIILGAVVFGVYDRRWDLYMLNVPDIHNLPLNSSGYTIEPLPFQITVSFVRGHDLYYADEDSIVYVSHDRDSPEKSLALGKSQVASPRLLFVSSRGTIFLGGNDSRMERSTDRGKSWEQVLSVPTWRMDEDEATGTLYVGNYSPRHHPIEMATVYKSTDEGETWQPVFTDNRLDHIHTVRYDPIFDRMYIAAGDDSTPRGQAWSDDNGKSWKWIANGRGNGHTDLAFSDHFVFWGSDDWYGRIIRSTRAQVQEGETILFAKRHQIWWVVARNQQIYAGTFLEHPKSQSGAFLIASDNEGHTWQKLIEVGQAGPKLKAFLGESRRLTSDGWVYFSTSEGQSYRVRKTSSE